MSAASIRNTRRRENLRRLVEVNGGVNECARLIKTPASHLSAILAGNAGIGDKLALKIEKAFGLHDGALDKNPEDAPPIPEIDLINQALIRLYLSNRMSREEVASMLQTLLAREKLSQI